MADRQFVPRSRLAHALVAVGVTGAIVLVLLWFSRASPAFASMLRGAIAVTIASGAYWLFKAVQPRTHGERRDGDRRAHRRRGADPTSTHDEPPHEAPARERPAR